MSDPSLAEIEQLAAAQGLLLRLQVRRWLAITSLRVVVARPRPDQPPLLVGELKGWALPCRMLSSSTRCGCRARKPRAWVR